MTIIESIRNYICTCPLLKDGKLSVDILGADPIEYVVESVPTTEIVKEYADGGKLKQYLFIFGSREYIDGTVRRSLENSGFYEDFADWIEEQDAAGNYPQIAGEKTAQKIEVLSTGYMFEYTGNNARYQIQCRLVYYEGGNKYGTN